MFDRLKMSHVALVILVDDEPVLERRDVSAECGPVGNSLIAPRHSEHRGEVEQLVSELAPSLRVARPHVKVLSGSYRTAVVGQ